MNLSGSQFSIKTLNIDMKFEFKNYCKEKSDYIDIILIKIKFIIGFIHPIKL